MDADLVIAMKHLGILEDKKDCPILSRCARLALNILNASLAWEKYNLELSGDNLKAEILKQLEATLKRTFPIYFYYATHITIGEREMFARYKETRAAAIVKKNLRPSKIQLSKSLQDIKL